MNSEQKTHDQFDMEYYLQEDIKDLLMKKLIELNEIITFLEKALTDAPEGTLRVTKNGNVNQFFHKTDINKENGSYIRKGNMEFIRLLAQKEYNTKLYSLAKRKQKELLHFMKKYPFIEITSVCDKIPKAKRCLIEPLFCSDEDFLKQWEEIKYVGKEIGTVIENAIYTERGEIVRSKSEKILADKFALKGIPYHYEKPLYMNGYGTIYPDFTLLNRRKRKEYYWEHLGLMDNEQYVNKTIKKLELMQKNGLYIGERLILTYETQAHPISIKAVDQLIEHYLV